MEETVFYIALTLAAVSYLFIFFSGGFDSDTTWGKFLYRSGRIGLWCVIGLLLFTLFMAVSPDKCPQCGHKTSKEYCSQCGALMETAPTCKNCGTALEEEWNFCEDCGYPVDNED